MMDPDRRAREDGGWSLSLFFLRLARTLIGEILPRVGSSQAERAQSGQGQSAPGSTVNIWRPVGAESAVFVCAESARRPERPPTQ
jgi:hypothetical protein